MEYHSVQGAGGKIYEAMNRDGGILNAKMTEAHLKKATYCMIQMMTFWKKQNYGHSRQFSGFQGEVEGRAASPLDSCYLLICMYLSLGTYCMRGLGTTQWAVISSQELL